MNEAIPAPPSVPEVASPTLFQVLNAKLDNARHAQKAAEDTVTALQNEIANIPDHLGELLYSDLMSRVDGWFA